MQDCAVVIIDCRIEILVQEMRINHVLDRIDCQIWVDCTSTITKQRCKMMYLTWFCTLDNQCNGSTLLRPNQMLLHRRYCKQRRNRYVVFIDTSVR